MSQKPATSIGVLLGNLPAQLSETLIRLVGEQPDMRLVGSVSTAIDLLLTAGDDTDVVILGAAIAVPIPPVCTHLLHEYAHLRIIVIGLQDPQMAMMYWLGLRRQQRHAVRPEQVLTSIRSAYLLDPLK